MARAEVIGNVRKIRNLFGSPLLGSDGRGGSGVVGRGEPMGAGVLAILIGDKLSMLKGSAKPWCGG